MTYFLLKWLHILGATLLFGTGLGIAFFFYRAHRTRHLPIVHFAAHQTVLADWIFTLPAVVLTPVTGFFLAKQGSFNLTSGWLGGSIILFVLAGLCWVPAAVLQMRMRSLAQNAMDHRQELPDLYWRYASLWFRLGVVAFPAVLGILVLMILKP